MVLHQFVSIPAMSTTSIKTCILCLLLFLAPPCWSTQTRRQSCGRAGREQAVQYEIQILTFGYSSTQ